MNGKKARAMRKEFGFVPSDPRPKDLAVNHKFQSETKVRTRTVVNAAYSPRALYQAFKRDA